LTLSACGAPQLDDARLAALNRRVELLTLFAACDDEAKLELLSEAAPDLGSKAKCKEHRDSRFTRNQAASKRASCVLRAPTRDRHWNQMEALGRVAVSLSVTED